MRTRIISDLHLGHSASRLRDPVMLEPVLDGVDHLVVAGDVWQQRKTGRGREEAGRSYKKLLDLVAKRGISLEVLRGNHDPDGGKGVAWLAERAILVTHGDAVYDDATPWSREIGAYREEVDAIIKRYEPMSDQAEQCSERAREIALALRIVPLLKLPPPLNFFATALWPPGRPFEMMRVWRGMGAEGLKFLERSGGGAQVLVCGHFHRPGIWEAGGKLMLNTGSFMQGSRPWAVDVNVGKITARVLKLRGGNYHPGEVRGRWLLRD